MNESSRDPRVQPSSAPQTVPKKKLMIVEIPISPIVHGIAVLTIELTGAESVIETPRLP